MTMINISPEEPKDEAFQSIETILGEKASEATLQQVKTELANVKQSAADTNGKIGKKEDGSTATTVFGKLKSIGDSLDTTLSSRAPSNTALSKNTWTDARAGAIDAINTNAANASTRAENARVAAVNAQNNTATNNTASKTGILSQKHAYTHNLLEHGTYGLSATKTTIDTINTNASNASTRAENARVAAVNAQNNTVTNNTANKTGLLSQKMTYTHNLLENGTYGLNAIKNVANTINTNAARGAVKSVQRGIANILAFQSSSASSAYLDITINAVNANKTCVFVDIPASSEKLEVGLDDKKQAAITLVNSNTIKIYMSPGTYSARYYIPWQVVEYY